MVKANAATFLDRKPLFPGRSCFPLSPGDDNPLSGMSESKKTDQLGVIFNVIGTSEVETDCQFVSDPQAMDYLRSFEKREGIDLQEKYPGCPEEGIELLKRMIRFNPFNRITVYEALRHPFFDSIRK